MARGSRIKPDQVAPPAGPLKVAPHDLECVRLAAQTMAMAEADYQVARATLQREVRRALIAVGASPNDEIDEHTGEVRRRAAP